MQPYYRIKQSVVKVAYEIQPRIARVRHLSEDHLTKIMDQDKKERYRQAMEQIRSALENPDAC